MSVIYIPIEIKKREFNSRLAVALASIELGVKQVVFGRDTEVFSKLTQPGIVLLKSAASFESQLIESLKAKGHSVVSLDEEGILPPLNDPSINSRFSPKILELLDKVFINGPLELKSLPSYVEKSDKLIMTGNPRFDFYRPDAKNFYNSSVGEIRKATLGKPIILLVSRFGDVNPVDGLDYQKLLEDNGYKDSEASCKFFTGFDNHSKKIFDEMLKLPSLLAKKYPESMIVIRPHPSESSKVWLDNNSMSNVIVNSDFDIASWLLCSDVMIHNGCTTAIEATALGGVVISFVPFEDNRYDLDFANNIGSKAKDFDQVISVFETSCRPSRAEQINKVNEVVCYSSKLKSSGLIAKELYNLSFKFDDAVCEYNLVKIVMDFVFSKEFVKTIFQVLKVKSFYHRKKFPFTSVFEVRSMANKISELFFYKKVTVKRVGADTFLLEACDEN